MKPKQTWRCLICGEKNKTKFRSSYQKFKTDMVENLIIKKGYDIPEHEDVWCSFCGGHNTLIKGIAITASGGSRIKYFINKKLRRI